jgi:hypothetical protein
MKYAFIERHKLVWPICVQCRVLLVSVSGYHDSVPVPPSQTRSGIVHAYLTPRAALAYPPEWLINAAFQAVETIASSRIGWVGDWCNSSAA